MAKRPQRRAVSRRPGELPDEKVRIDFVVLGDFAQAVGGKVTIVGAGWNVVNGTSYPTTIPFGIGIGILVPWAETNRGYNFSFSIRRSEGGELASGGGEFEVGRQPGTPLGMAQRVTMGIAGQLQVPEPGTYELAVSCGDDEKIVVFEALRPPVNYLPPPGLSRPNIRRT